MSKFSAAWNRDRFAGAVKLGVPGAGRVGERQRPHCRPRRVDRENGAADDLVAFTRQKYVPLGRPLSRAKVGIGSPLRTSVNPSAMTTLRRLSWRPPCRSIGPSGSDTAVHCSVTGWMADAVSGGDERRRGQRRQRRGIRRRQRRNADR